MTNLEDFMPAILANPYDETPKGMYADWLIENQGFVECVTCRGEGRVLPYRGPQLKCLLCKGEGRISNGYKERGEFIQRHMANSNLDVSPWIKWFKTPLWFPELYAKSDTQCFNAAGKGDLTFNGIGVFVQLRNGFVQEVTAPWRTLVKHAAVLFSQPITKVTLTDSGFLAADGQLVEVQWPRTLRVALGADPRLEIVYDTKAEADAVLSGVCVDWGRKQYNARHYLSAVKRQLTLDGIDA